MNEKKAKFTEYLRKFHNSPKTVDDYVSFIGKCAWALSQGSSLTWGDLAEIAKEVGIPLTVPENSDYVPSKENKTMSNTPLVNNLRHFADLNESFRATMRRVSLNDSVMYDVDGFARTLGIHLTPDDEIIVTFTGGFATSKSAHIAEECVGKLWHLISKSNSNTPISKEFELVVLGFNYFMFKSFGMVNLLKQLIPDKNTVDQLLNSNVDIVEKGGSFMKPGYQLREFWSTLTVNLAKKGYKIVKVEE